MIALLAVLAANPIVAAAHDVAIRTGVLPAIILAVVEVESRGRPGAISRDGFGSVGLMQLIPETAAGVAKRWGIKGYQLTKVYDNVLIGSRYLAELLARYGDLESALTAYNMGMGRFERNHQKPNAYARRVVAIATKNLRRSL